jgi:hypothetical protein
MSCLPFRHLSNFFILCHDDGCSHHLLLVVATATLVARTIEPRSIYDARLSDVQVHERQRARDHAPGSRQAD